MAQTDISPSPAASIADNYGLGELAQHNTAMAASSSTPHQPLSITLPISHPPSQTPSRYSSPPLPTDQQQQFYHDPQLGHGLTYPAIQNGYGNQLGYPADSSYPNDESIYGALPDEHLHPQAIAGPYGTLATSPPTPQPLDVARVQTTTSNRLQRSAAKRRPARASPTDEEPKPKRARKGRAPKAVQRAPFLDQPLSVLAKGMTEPMVDIDAYVQRSVETRQAEVQTNKIPGKVNRPMNAFMLYRKAYQHHSKALCDEKNHQVVSQMCGRSWRQESDEVREQFNEWARIERDCHEKAHPGYKFTPAKPRNRRDDEISPAAAAAAFRIGGKRRRGTPGGGDPAGDGDSGDDLDLDRFGWTGGLKRLKHDPTDDPDYVPPRSSLSSAAYHGHHLRHRQTASPQPQYMVQQQQHPASAWHYGGGTTAAASSKPPPAHYDPDMVEMGGGSSGTTTHYFKQRVMSASPRLEDVNAMLHVAAPPSNLYDGYGSSHHHHQYHGSAHAPGMLHGMTGNYSMDLLQQYQMRHQQRMQHIAAAQHQQNQRASSHHSSAALHQHQHQHQQQPQQYTTPIDPSLMGGHNDMLGTFSLYGIDSTTSAGPAPYNLHPQTHQPGRRRHPQGSPEPNAGSPGGREWEDIGRYNLSSPAPSPEPPQPQPQPPVNAEAGAAPSMHSPGFLHQDDWLDLGGGGGGDLPSAGMEVGGLEESFLSALPSHGHHDLLIPHHDDDDDDGDGEGGGGGGGGEAGLEGGGDPSWDVDAAGREDGEGAS